MTISGPGGTLVSADYPGGVRGAALTRHVLDKLLLEAAMAAGAACETGVILRPPLAPPRPARGTGARGAASGDRDNCHAGAVTAAAGRHSKLAFGMGLT